MKKAPGVVSSHFTPAETASISGVQAEVQRDWRKRGFLPSPVRGHARFDPFQVAQLFVMRLLAELHVGPSHARITGAEAAPAIILHALLNHEGKAYAIQGSSAAIGRYEATLERDTGEFYRIAGISFAGSFPRFCITWRDGSHFFTSDLNKAHDDQLSGATLNLELIARDLVIAARRPLFTIFAR